MKRRTVNAAVDLIALAAFVLLTATGLVLEYRLPEGSGGLSGTGTGRGAASHPVALVLGLTRHAWGDVHFWVAVALFAALATHLYLHAAWFRTLLRRPPAPEPDPFRATLGVVGLVALVGAAVVPFLAPREVVPRAELTGMEAAEDAMGAIRGRTTLGEAAGRAGVSHAYLAGALGLPPDTAPGARLGELGRAHGFTLGDVRRAVDAAKREPAGP